MKRWKALVLLGTLCLGLLLPWQAVAQEEPAGQLAEESGGSGVTEQLDWDVQSVLEQLGLSVTAPDETRGKIHSVTHLAGVLRLPLRAHLTAFCHAGRTADSDPVCGTAPGHPG